MKFTPLKQSKEIEKEAKKKKVNLPRSEYVWVRFTTLADYHNGSVGNTKVVKRSKAEGNKYINPEILAPAWHCEELGEILFKLGLRLHKNAKESFWLGEITGCEIEKHFYAPNETEARGEAVKFALKEM